MLLAIILFITFKDVQHKNALLLSNIIWVIVSIILANILINKVFKSLEYVNEYLCKIANGNLTQKIDVNKKSIFKNTCININNLVLSVRGFINQSTIMTDKIINYCEYLNDNGKQIELSVNQNCETINKVSSDMTEQTNSVIKTQEFFEEIVNSHNNIVKNGKVINDTAVSMINTIEEDNKIYDELIEKMNKSKSFNNELAPKIKKLYEKAYNIQDIADSVNKISKSTNLLSLNASIEAAKAKESGSGFSVVANEIRKLAESSSKQANQIQNIINDIKSEITDISSNMDKEVESINESIEFSNITKKNLSKTYSQSLSTLKSIKNINNNIEVQNEKVLNIKTAVGKLAAISENTTASAQETAASSEEQLTSIKNIFNSISNLIDMNKKIKDKIDSFAGDYEITEETKKQIQKGFKILRKISKYDGLSSMEYKVCTKILKENIGKYPEFELFGLVQKDGLRKAISLDYDEKEVYTSFSHRPYFKAAIKGKEFASDPYVSVDTNDYIITIAVPVRDKNNEIAGVLVADLILG